MRQRRLNTTLLILLVVLTAACERAGAVEAEGSYHAIAVGGTVCGYSRLTSEPAEFEGVPTTLMKQKIFIMVTALGMEVNSEMSFDFQIDPETNRMLFHRGTVESGPQNHVTERYALTDQVRAATKTK